MRSRWLWAALALVAVLGITTAASATTRGLITGKQIANYSINSKKLVNHTIQQHDLSNGLVSSLKGATGPAGPKGATGPAGPQGPAGPAGTFNISGVTRIMSNVVNILPGAEGTAIATCGSGIALSGGFASGVWYGANEYGSYYVTDVGPTTDGRGWYVTLYNSASATDSADIQAYAVCYSG